MPGGIIYDPSLPGYGRLLVCHHCGEQFRARCRRFCSRECERRSQYVPKPPKTVPCRHCGKRFEKQGCTAKRVYCSEKCGERFWNHRQGHIASGTKITATCKGCGQSFDYKLGKKPKTHCSVSCWRKSHPRTHERVNRRCKGCGKDFVGGRSTKFCSDKCRASNRPMLAGVCKECGNPFVRSHRAQSGWCSKACADRFHKRQRYARKKKVEVEKVFLAVLFERDNGICQLCRKPVDRARIKPDPKSPTMDHVIPISRGGEHSYANTQLAHFGCNSSKCDRILSLF